MPPMPSVSAIVWRRPKLFGTSKSVTVHGDFVSWGYVGTAAGYGALWIAGLLVLAAAIFQRRDFA